MGLVRFGVLHCVDWLSEYDVVKVVPVVIFNLGLLKLLLDQLYCKFVSCEISEF